MENEAESDERAARVVRGTFAALATWKLRGIQAYRPEPGSDLSIDDEDWPYFPTSTVAWSGLHAASDHLNAIRKHVETTTLFPIAHLTLCRSALIGAAQVVWVLDPGDRDERIRRSRTVTMYLYKKHLQYLRGLQDLSGPRHPGTDAVAARVNQRIGELSSKRAADNQDGDLIATNMIRDAATSAFTEPELVKQVVLAWRSTSGAAHGAPWPLFGTPGTKQSMPADEQGIAEFQAGGSLGRIANSYMASFYLAEHGWLLLDQRGAGRR